MSSETPQPGNEHRADTPELHVLRIGDIAGGVEKQTDAMLSTAMETTSEHPNDVLNNLYNVLMEERPLVRSDVQEHQTIRMRADDLEQLLFSIDADEFTLIDAYGRKIPIVNGCIPEDGILVINQSDLGDTEGRPHLDIVR